MIQNRKEIILIHLNKVDDNCCKNSDFHKLIQILKYEIINSMSERINKVIMIYEERTIISIINLILRAIKYYQNQKILLSNSQILDLLIKAIVNYDQIIETELVLNSQLLIKSTNLILEVN
ncbi:MAG: hypothetical protein KQ78_00840 [Candidatus Izimaplasma bacterium HR2]|nr:MAG: hypothetical protein KQ78_00840 [Candidatus Izimaplasma bacterium HR2]